MNREAWLCVGLLALLLPFHLAGCQPEPPPPGVMQTSGSLQTIQDARFARQLAEQQRLQIDVLRDSVAQLGRVQRELEIRVMVLERLQEQR